MKKSGFPAVLLIMIVTSCGPAAEDREKMHLRAKIFQDSIANVIRTSMAEAAAPGPNQVVADTTKKATAATSTVK